MDGLDSLCAFFAIVFLVSGFVVGTTNVAAAQIYFWASVAVAACGIVVHLISRARSPRKESF